MFDVYTSHSDFMDNKVTESTSSLRFDNVGFFPLYNTGSDFIYIPGKGYFPPSLRPMKEFE